MRQLIIGAALLALAGPAFAQQAAGAPAAGAPASDTLKEITTKGIVLSVGGMDIDVKYTPDGKFTAMDGQVTGEWRTDGDKLCTKSNFQPDEECTVYPTGKKSGDTFDLTSAQGTATIKIK